MGGRRPQVGGSWKTWDGSWGKHGVCVKNDNPSFQSDFFNQCSLEKIGKEGASSIHPSIHPFIHSFIHSYIHTFIHLYIYTYIPIYQWHTQMGTCMHLHMRTSTLTRVHRCTHTYTCMCYHLHLHVCQLYICTQQPFGIYVGVIVWIGDRHLWRLRWVWLLLARSRQLRLQLLPLLWHSAFVTKQKLWEPCSQGSGCD